MARRRCCRFRSGSASERPLLSVSAPVALVATGHVRRRQLVGPLARGARPGIAVFAQSLAVDEGSRDREVFTNFLKRYNLLETITLSWVTTALAAHTGHNDAGDTAVVNSLKAAIGPDAVAALKKPEVGVPMTVS